MESMIQNICLAVTVWFIFFLLRRNEKSVYDNKWEGVTLTLLNKIHFSIIFQSSVTQGYLVSISRENWENRDKNKDSLSGMHEWIINVLWNESIYVNMHWVFLYNFSIFYEPILSFDNILFIGNCDKLILTIFIEGKINIDLPEFIKEHFIICEKEWWIERMSRFYAFRRQFIHLIIFPVPDPDASISL